MKKNELFSDDDRQMAIEFLLSVLRDKSAKVLLKLDPVIAAQSAGFN